MKRLLLASSGLEYIKTFVGKDPKSVKLLFIPTAGNLDDEVWWIDKDRDVLARMGFHITELDIEHSSKTEMQKSLSDTDIVYVAGGNTFFLLKQLRETGFDAMLTEYVNSGGLYAGASAGALIAGADIGAISSLDEPEKVQGLKSTEGLGWVNVIPIPHYDMKARTQPIVEIKTKYDKDNEMVLLTDDQALLVEDNHWKVVDSPRSELEHEWFKKAHVEQKMNVLVTGTPGSGKTSLVDYASKVNDSHFVDADEVEGLCEWREFNSGEVLGLVTEHKETGKDDWYAKYGWYWREDVLKQFLKDNPDSVICGSAENTVESYPLFNKIVLLEKNEDELLANLASPDRNNPFGKTPDQRKNFMNWQDYLIREADKFKPIIITGNDVSKTYTKILASIA